MFTLHCAPQIMQPVLAPSTNFVTSGQVLASLNLSFLSCKINVTLLHGRGAGRTARDRAEQPARARGSAVRRRRPPPPPPPPPRLPRLLLSRSAGHVSLPMVTLAFPMPHLGNGRVSSLRAAIFTISHAASEGPLSLWAPGQGWDV